MNVKSIKVDIRNYRTYSPLLSNNIWQRTRYIIPELVMEVLGLGNLTKVNNNVLP